MVSLLASIGVLQTPSVSWGNSRHTCGVPGYYKSASFRRPGPNSLAFRRHLAVSPVTRNRRPSDALVVMGCFDWLADALDAVGAWMRALARRGWRWIYIKHLGMLAMAFPGVGMMRLVALYPYSILSGLWGICRPRCGVWPL